MIKLSTNNANLQIKLNNDKTALYIKYTNNHAYLQLHSQSQQKN